MSKRTRRTYTDEFKTQAVALAAACGPALCQRFDDVDAFALSSELGIMKLHPDIYRHICSRLGFPLPWDVTTPADHVVIIGDSPRCDRDGPALVGISGYHLDRTGGGQITDLVQFATRVLESARIESGRTPG
ncbi:hypothetical protein [Pseudomonas sp. HLS-6 TE3448]